ncbi:hypothetical protein [uncultured Clostridium sp.]|uniref:hypothetical protein n=1 Tax=uncultured Clostridium sp. TaxID=59620 RepID=UPI0028E780B0|nr:hypothetical protein [uncultured Clostridium sp.]
MEYRLNKIDTEIRQRVEESTKEGIVHRKKDIKIDKDVPEKREEKDFSEQLKKYSKKKKKAKIISVEAEKVEEVDVEAVKYKAEEKHFSSGRFLDTKR